MKEEMTAVITVFLTAVIAILFAWFIFNVALKNTTDLPQVYWSTSQNKCVKIIDKGVERDCSKIPEIYHKIWVK